MVVGALGIAHRCGGFPAVTSRLGGAPEDSWSDRTWLGSIGAVKVRLAVQAEFSQPRAVGSSGDDEFLLRRLLAGEPADPLIVTVPPAVPRELIDGDLDPNRVLSLPEFAARFRTWAEEGAAPAALDIDIDGLLSVEYAMGRETSGYVKSVLLTRMLDASHATAVLCELAGNRVLLAQPSTDKWVFRILRAVEEPILVANGEVRVIGEHAASMGVADES